MKLKSLLFLILVAVFLAQPAVAEPLTKEDLAFTFKDTPEIPYDAGVEPLSEQEKRKTLGDGWLKLLGDIGAALLTKQAGKEAAKKVVKETAEKAAKGNKGGATRGRERAAEVQARNAARQTTKSVRGVDDLVGAAAGKARSSGDIVVPGGRDRAKELFREFDAKGVGNRTIVRDKTGSGRGVEGALGDGTPFRIRMKPDGTTRIQAGKQKFIFPPN